MKSKQILNSLSDTAKLLANGASWSSKLFGRQLGSPLTDSLCLQIIKDIEQEESNRLQSDITKTKVDLGDLIHISYELTRSRNLITSFEGYCIEKINKGIHEKLTLRNTVKGVGMQISFYIHSKRILSLSILHKSSATPVEASLEYFDSILKSSPERQIKNYPVDEYEHKPGLINLEPIIRDQLLDIQKERQLRRDKAQLPNYISAGPYSIEPRWIKEKQADIVRTTATAAIDNLKKK